MSGGNPQDPSEIYRRCQALKAKGDPAAVRLPVWGRVPSDELSCMPRGAEPARSCAAVELAVRALAEAACPGDPPAMGRARRTMLQLLQRGHADDPWLQGRLAEYGLGVNAMQLILRSRIEAIDALALRLLGRAEGHDQAGADGA